MTEKLTVGQEVRVTSALGDEPGRVEKVGRLYVYIDVRGRIEQFDRYSRKHYDWVLGRHVTFSTNLSPEADR